jgi:hypothetical protein
VSTAEFSDVLGAIGTGPLGVACNRSYASACPEEDNVTIPLRSRETTRFHVFATHPLYEVGVDQCSPDFSTCGRAARAADDCVPLLDNGIDVLETCISPTWWQPYTMVVSVENQSAPAHYLRLYRKITDENSWPQVLVLYQDGNVRIKPHAPSGRSDVCFGSSVVVGPARGRKRPHADIQAVAYDPATSSFEVVYIQSGTATLHIAADRAQAELTVDRRYRSPRFAVLRSMWVDDGNADVDHIETSSVDLPILGDWRRLTSTSWWFYRATRSVHNTSAPDLLIATLEAFQTDAWVPVGTFNGPVRDLEQVNGVLFAITTTPQLTFRLVRSRDQGQTWEEVEAYPGGAPGRIRGDDQLYAIGGGISVVGSYSWLTSSADEGDTFSIIETVPFDPITGVASYQGWLWYSVGNWGGPCGVHRIDPTGQYTNANGDLPFASCSVTTLILDSHDPASVAYIYSYPGYVFRTTDAGTHWSPMNITDASRAPMYAAGLLLGQCEYSTDHGVSWLASGICAQTYLENPAGDGFFAVANEGGVFSGTPGGAWLPLGLEHELVLDLIATDTALYAATVEGEILRQALPLPQ